MTKAMRWGVSALFILGAVGVGGFVGCSSDDTGTPVPEDTGTTPEDTATVDTGSAVDTGTADTGTTPTDSGSETAMETGPKPADRAATLVFASPDLGAKYACFGAFTTADPASVDAPAQALGPIGIPDSTAPTDATKYKPIPYGAVIPLPLDATAAAALQGLTTVLYLTDTNPLTASPATTCAAVWKTVKTNTKMWTKVAPGTVAKGDHALVVAAGCINAGSATTTECGAGNNFELTLKKADTTKAASFSGESTGPKVGIDFVHLSQYAGGSATIPPSWQNIDAYLVPSKASGVTVDAGTDDSGDATTADGGTTVSPDVAHAVKIATGKKYGDVVSVVGFQAGDIPDGTYLVIVPTGAVLATSVPCSTAVSPTCAAYIPMKPFLASLKAAGAGFIDGQNQFVALAGGPVPKGLTDAGAPDPTTAPIRILMGNADKP